jgi:hypothetical protein
MTCKLDCIWESAEWRRAAEPCAVATFGQDLRVPLPYFAGATFGTEPHKSSSFRAPPAPARRPRAARPRACILDHGHLTPSAKASARSENAPPISSCAISFILHPRLPVAERGLLRPGDPEPRTGPAGSTCIVTGPYSFVCNVNGVNVFSTQVREPGASQLLVVAADYRHRRQREHRLLARCQGNSSSA